MFNFNFKVSILLFAFLIALCTASITPIYNENTKIFGGSTAPQAAYPYMVSLRQADNFHFCGASLISSQYILTAGHCVYEKLTLSIIAVVGTNSLASGGTRYLIDEVILHEDYNPANDLNDIALLRVEQEVVFDQSVQPIRLAETVATEDISAILTGWGLTTDYPDSLRPPADLQHINLTIISNEDCQKAVGDRLQIDHRRLCTYEDLGKGLCLGDSGSPLSRSAQQIGIVSTGVPCARGLPDVYTSVAAFRTWIREKSGV